MCLKHSKIWLKCASSNVPPQVCLLNVPPQCRSFIIVHGWHSDDLYWIYALLSRKHTSRDSCVFGVKFWTQIFVCVKKLTLSNSASMQVLYNCSWFTIWRFILDLRTFVAKSALSRLRALGGSFWPKHFNGPGAPHPCPLPSFIAWNGDLQQQRWGPNGGKMWTWKVYIWQID